MIIKNKQDIINFLQENCQFIHSFNKEFIDITILLVCKKNLKKKYPNDDVNDQNFYIYIPNTKETIWNCACLFFCESSLNFLEKQNFDYFLIKDMERSKKMFLKYRKWLNNNIDYKHQSQFMLFSSVVLYLLGHRAINDIDLYIHSIPDFVYEKTTEFLDSGVVGETAEDWLNRRSKLNINSLFKENKNVKSNFRLVETKTEIRENAPGQQLQRKIGKVDSVTDGDIKYTSGYDPRGYYEDSGDISGQKGGPKVQVLPTTKEPSFQKDKEKVKAQKNKTFNVVMSRSVNQGTGIGDTYNSRVPGVSSGLGNQTYSEQKSFGSFRKVKEAIDDPGACDMGVGGVLGGSSNKEPLVTSDDVKIKTSEIIKKKKKNGD
jgi:hypothetical protein